MNTPRCFPWLAFIALFILAALPASPAIADQVIADDLIVQGAACLGADCADGTVWIDSEELQLKENNLRIFFDDTSVVGSYPDNDWEFIFNDETSGGEDYFAIKDYTNSVTPFRVDANSIDNALYVDSSGNVGLGTNSPSATLHVSGNSYVTGTFGLGTASPEEKLHVVGNALVEGNFELRSSRDAKQNIKTLPAQEAMDALEQLRPVTYQYKSDPTEDSIGFIAEEAPDLVATSSRKSLRPMDIVAVLAKVVQEQQKQIDRMAGKIAELEAQRTGASSAIPVDN